MASHMQHISLAVASAQSTWCGSDTNCVLPAIQLSFCKILPLLVHAHQLSAATRHVQGLAPTTQVLAEVYHTSLRCTCTFWAICCGKMNRTTTRHHSVQSPAAGLPQGCCSAARKCAQPHHLLTSHTASPLIALSASWHTSGRA